MENNKPNKNTTPLISVIMPVFNTRKYIEDAIKSIFYQTITDWELIIIDDNSNDGTYEYLKTLDDNRIRLYRNNKNMHNSFTINRGIKLAIGKYIAKMDSDDICYPTRFENQLDYLHKHPEVDVLSCGLLKIDSDGFIIAKTIFPVEHKDIINYFSLSKNLIFGPDIYLTDGSLFGKTEWFKKWQYNNMKYSQDFNLYFRARHTSVYANVPAILYIYRKVGVTNSIKSKTISIKNKFITIFTYGFRKDEKIKSFLAIISLILRFFTALGTPTIINLMKKFKKNKKGGNTQIKDLMNNLEKFDLPRKPEKGNII